MKLAETALDSLFLAGKPEKLIGGKAYDSDKLDGDLLKKHGVEMIAPHRRNRTKLKIQDGRKLRRYQSPLESRAAFRLAAKLQAAGCQI